LDPKQAAHKVFILYGKILLDVASITRIGYENGQIYIFPTDGDRIHPLSRFLDKSHQDYGGDKSDYKNFLVTFIEATQTLNRISSEHDETIDQQIMFVVLPAGSEEAYQRITGHAIVNYLTLSM
jgi:hypothetical protein